MLQLRQIKLRRGAKVLLQGAELQVYPGQKVGLVGPNGSGKSSLFALIRGELMPESGEVRLPKEWRIAHVAQQTPGGPRPTLEFVLDGDEELRQVQRAIQRAEQQNDGIHLGELHARFEAIGGYSAQSRAARILQGLGFAPDRFQDPVERWSGGWRMRLALARTLIARSDLLLLDEPTNHLDLDAVLWLEAWLRQYPGALLLISHDREFLDAVVQQIVQIQGQRLHGYGGNYSAFEAVRAERLAQQQSAYRRQQQEIARIQGFVARFRAKATKAKQAQSRLRALERMKRIVPAHVDAPFRFAFPAPKRLPYPLLTLEQAGAGYGDPLVLENVSLSLAPGDRIGLLGPNGAGKSTLIRMLAGTLPLRSGRRISARDLQIGYFAQHQLDQLHPEESPLQHLQRLAPEATEQELRNFLGGFAFTGDRVLEPVTHFSGGERARLALALLVWQRPNLLLLDEPTNHLDLDMRQALSEALQSLDGALVIVSHDRHLLRVTADRLLLVEQGRVVPFSGDLDAYANERWNNAQARPRTVAAAVPSRREQRRREAEARRRLRPLKQRLQTLEKDLASLAQRKQQLEAQFAAPALYEPENKAQLRALLEEKRQLEGALARLEADWLAASEVLEAQEHG